MAVSRRVQVSTQGATTGSLRPLWSFCGGIGVVSSGSPCRGGPSVSQVSAQVPSSMLRPRVRSRLRLIAAARVVHQALFLLTPR